MLTTSIEVWIWIDSRLGKRQVVESQIGSKIKWWWTDDTNEFFFDNHDCELMSKLNMN